MEKVAKPSDRFKDRDEFITHEEVVQALRIKVMTVYRYIRQGNLGAIRIGRSYRIGRKDVDAFIKSSRVENI